MITAVLAGAGFGLGLALALAVLVPPRASLAQQLGDLDAAARAGPRTGGPDGPGLARARWLVGEAVCIALLH